MEVDVLGLAEASQLTTPRVAITTSTPLLEYAWSSTVGVPAGSRQQATLRSALVSTDKEEAVILFNVKSAPISVSGRPAPANAAVAVATGFVNLRDVLAQGRDLLDTPVAINSKDGPAGTLKASVVALDALRAAVPASVLAQFAQPGAPPPGAPPAAATAVRVEVGALQLNPKLRADPEVGELWVEIDFVAIDPAEVPTQRSIELVTERVRKAAAPLDFRYKGAIPVAPGSTEQAALRKAMTSDDEELADVFFVLKTKGRSGAEREIGQAFLNLKQLKAGGADVVGQTLPLQPPPGSAPEGPGKLTISLFALEAFASLDKPSSGGTSAAPPDTLLVEVGKLALRPEVRKDIDVGDVFVQVDLLGLVASAQLATQMLHKGSSPLDFQFSQGVTVVPGSREQQKLRAALTSADEQEADVYFELKTVGARNEPREVAAGSLSLRKALGANAEHRQAQVQLLSAAGGAPAGTLSVSLLALDVMKAAVADKPAAPAGPSRASVGGVETVRIELGALQLDPKVRRDPSVDEVWVEVDFVDVRPSAELATARVRKTNAPLDLRFEQSLTIAPGSAEQAALKKALSSTNDEDAKVFFDLMARGPRGGVEKKIGQGDVSLKQLLGDGQDLSRVPIKLAGEPLGNDPPPTVGTLTASIGALAALQSALAPPAGVTADIVVDVGSLQLDPKLRTDPSVGELWVQIDLLDTQLRTPLVRKAATPLDFRYQHAIPVAPGSTEQAALRKAMASAVDQDADVYFDLKTTARGGKEESKGLGFVNFKELLARGRDFDAYPIKLQGRSGNAGTLKVSLLALDALRALDAGAGGSAAKRFIAGGPSAAPAGSDFPTAGTGYLEVEIGAFVVSPALRNNQDAGDLWVEVDLGPQVAERRELTTDRIHKLTSRFDFKFRHGVAIAPGSAEQAALRRMLEDPDEQASDIFFEVQSLSPRNQPVEVGLAMLNLKKVLDEGRDVKRAQCIVKARSGASMGTLTVSLTALQVLRDALAGGGAPPAQGREAPAVGRQSSASRFVDSFGGQAPAPAPSAASRFLAGAPATSAAPAPARATAQSARATAQPARATATARGQQPAEPPPEGSDSALTIRLESVTLGATTQRDPQIPFFLLSARVLGKTYSTAEVRKTSPPIRLNHTIEVPVPPGSPEQQSLTRVMQYGKRETADVTLALEWFDPSASGGGDEPEQLAFGAINLRQLWESRRDLASQRVELLTDDGEVTTVVISTSAIPALERVMQPRR